MIGGDTEMIVLKRNMYKSDSMMQPLGLCFCEVAPFCVTRANSIALIETHVGLYQHVFMTHFCSSDSVSTV